MPDAPMPDGADVRARWARVKALVAEALDRPPAERDVFVGALSPPSLAREVADLVSAYADAEAEGVLSEAFTPSPGLSAGEQVGPYRLVEALGVGGMGAVYRARRADGRLDRDVALKVVRHATPALVRRFERERTALARLEHAHIARLYDAGVAEGGLLGEIPFLAMELVDGEPITAAAERRALSVEDRVRLVLQVCDAVAYAHGRLVLHRDLKPSNVLVSDTDDGLRAVVLDFGVAKLLDPTSGPGAADAALTQPGGAAYTAAYAAPEQLAGGEATAATDVYGLGGLLYEVLASARPYAIAEATAAQTERLKSIAPRPPSSIAPPARALRGDLDTICRKALDPDPARRYASAGALAEDLRRFLDGLPVSARPATARYRAGRFLRRHGVGVASAALVTAALVALVAFYTVRLAGERDRARAAERVAVAERDRATAVSRFLEQILVSVNDRWNAGGSRLGREATVREALAVAAERAERDFAGRPDLRADLHLVLGQAYAGLGLGAESAGHIERTLALRESLYTPPHPALAEALYYASFLPARARESLAMQERALAMIRARPDGNNLPFVVEAVATQRLLAGRTDGLVEIIHEATQYASRTFVPGRDGARYRDPALAMLGLLDVRAHLAAGEMRLAAAALARADAALARLPPTPDYDFLRRNAVCHARALDAHARLGRAADAETALRRCQQSP